MKLPDGRGPDLLPRYRALAPLAEVVLITACGAGLYPHLSPAGAAVQVAHVARARHLDPARVNELQLNLALDALAPARR